MECILNKELVSRRAQPALSTDKIESEERERELRACALRIYNNEKRKSYRRVSSERRFCYHCQTKNEDRNINMRTFRIRI